ncbi:aminotransferase class I/II-fold pyridoxal phosphate-dependent enzyme, partial [Klebsiella pneumoniae]|uniref:aminotransferase class I/II-fold pyridoxal phosphate-dependent enzyme n=1 Tax=Klebsiella pneumoniae TaxID=573 RepID=UPI003F4E477B
VWVSNPSWPNHKSVFTSAGLEVREYAYYDAANHALDFDGLLADKAEVAARAFLLQGIDEQQTHTLDALAHIGQFLLPDCPQ